MSRKTRRIAREAVAIILAVGLAAWLTSLLTGCTDPYLAAYRTTATARATAATAEQALADSCRAKADACKASSGGDAAKYAACWAPCKHSLESWIQYGRPAVNSALAAALAAIQLAELTKRQPSPLEYLKPVACALAQALKQWGHLLPPATRSQIESVAGLVALATCEAKP